MSLDGQFTKNLAFVDEEECSTLETGQGLVWPATPSIPNQIWPGALKLSPFLDFLTTVCDVEADDTLEPEEVQQVAQKLDTFVQILGVHQDTDDIFYKGEDEEEALTYEWIRDLSVLFRFAAQEEMYLYVYR
jgi:hypothetical protein